MEFLNIESKKKRNFKVYPIDDTTFQREIIPGDFKTPQLNCTSPVGQSLKKGKTLFSNDIIGGSVYFILRPSYT